MLEPEKPGEGGLDPNSAQRLKDQKPGADGKPTDQNGKDQPIKK